MADRFTATIMSEGYRVFDNIENQHVPTGTMDEKDAERFALFMIAADTVIDEAVRLNGVAPPDELLVALADLTATCAAFIEGD